MVVFVVYAFTLAIYIQATGTSSEVNNASIAFVDEDGSALSKELFNAFYPPRFKFPEMIPADAGPGRRWTRAATCSSSSIPPALRARPARRPQSRRPGEHRRHRHAAGRHRRRLHQEHRQRPGRVLPEAHRGVAAASPSALVVRKLFNPNAISSWFKSVVAIINQITPADRGPDRRRGDPRARARHARAPAGDAADLVRDRHGEGVGQRPGDPGRHRRLAVPDRADGAEGAVRRLGRPCGSSGVVLYLFFATALGIFLGTISRSMAQFALLIILVIVVLMLLSGGIDSGREPAEVAAVPHLLPAVAALRQLLAGDHLPRRRLRRGLAPVPDGGRGRAGVLRLQPALFRKSIAVTK